MIKLETAKKMKLMQLSAWLLPSEKVEVMNYKNIPCSKCGTVSNTTEIEASEWLRNELKRVLLNPTRKAELVRNDSGNTFAVFVDRIAGSDDDEDLDN